MRIVSTSIAKTTDAVSQVATSIAVSTMTVNLRNSALVGFAWKTSVLRRIAEAPVIRADALGIIANSEAIA